MADDPDAAFGWRPATPHKPERYRALILVAVVCLLTGYLLGRPSGPTEDRWSLPEESIVQAAEAEAKRVAEAQKLEAERRQQEAAETKRKEGDRRAAVAEAEVQRLDTERRQQEAAEAKRKEDERRVAVGEAQAKHIGGAQRPEPERRQQAATGSRRTEDERYQRPNNAPKPEPTGMPRDYRALREYMLSR
jgi:hypothetical protein